MQIELHTEDVLQIVSALNSQIDITRRGMYKTSDRISRRNIKLKLERLNRLSSRLFHAVEENFGDTKGKTDSEQPT